MKKILFLSATLLACACHSEKPLTPEEEFARAKGEEFAQTVIDAKPGTMQREKAILDIRAMEQKILAKGDTAAARAFIRAAEAKLDSALVFYDDIP